MTNLNQDALGVPVLPRSSKLRPLGQSEVTLMGGFWREWQDLNARTIIDHCLTWMERVGWIPNFDHAASGAEYLHAGEFPFVDSEVYKLLEAMAWELGSRPTDALQSQFDELVSRVAAAQEPDGYLNTAFGRRWQRPRWSDLEQGHELYCAGHLIQAAVARLRAGVNDLLVEVACAFADLLVREFGPGGRDAVCGHPEVEMALVELSRSTGETSYLELARIFVDRRGYGLLNSSDRGAQYYLDDVPVRDAEVLRGHAVRALYLASGAVDVAVETDDAELLVAVERQWQATVARRAYITGAMGSHHQDEAFGEDFELPADRAYGETCAGIGSVMLSWRLLLQTGAAKYADLIERTLLNNVLASPREDGRAFFYSNTLHQRTRGQMVDDGEPNPRAESGLRAPWFEVSCCPTNVSRTLASLSTYIATANDGGVQIHQYADADIAAELTTGRLRLRMETSYPLDDAIRITVLEAPNADVTLQMRIPPFARGGAILGGDRIDESYDSVEINRTLAANEVIELVLPQAVRRVRADPRIDAVRGSVAFERGPFVLAIESVDLPDGIEVNDLVLLAGPRDEISEAVATVGERAPRSDTWAYQSGGESSKVREVGDIPLRPYYRWANRGPSTMRVWMPLAGDHS